MLSYQHGFHAGNLADVHKHSLLAWIIAYMTRKDKPLTYLETHAGRGLYGLTDEAAIKTGEAARGIRRAADWFAPDHPYMQVLSRICAKHGNDAYPGSPLVAAELLRPMDNIILSELHPQEFAALQANMAPYGGIFQQQNGWEAALSRTPPDPRRGLMLVDPSFEVKEDYKTIPDFFAKIHRKWPVGVLILWYPILADNRHIPMTKTLSAMPNSTLHEVHFPPARPGHGMVGSGLVIINPPYGFDQAGADISRLFHDRAKQPM